MRVKMLVPHHPHRIEKSVNLRIITSILAIHLLFSESWQIDLFQRNWNFEWNWNLLLPFSQIESMLCVPFRLFIRIVWIFGRTHFRPKSNVWALCVCVCASLCVVVSPNRQKLERNMSAAPNAKPWVGLECKLILFPKEIRVRTRETNKRATKNPTDGKKHTWHWIVLIKFDLGRAVHHWQNVLNFGMLFFSPPGHTSVHVANGFKFRKAKNVC